ncbi:HlyD family efflux transporter periplasmic adaptor subunit [Oscillatoria sp. FACHB-1407]|uniref:HlyD family efflux transporter periplasmic adaptor subunit n=1 Tax=Oscillatoria sp. FACHB-1407 TaxID=2692847 RepID=UPI0016876817|nr:HlyD family efflux transporter periplasmic adaptor subunit [Oscillatoria sp. FACHB-1407]MBD2459459.1 HlyD family efflux transporter periplasmic adaptor subunit [Oscillatoria sp. FACHB-1407]
MVRSQPFSFNSRHYIVLAILITLWGGVTACSDSSQAEVTPTPTPNEVQQTPTIVALGRLTPNGEVIKLSVPNAQDSRVNQILVEEGDWVEAGQVIAVLQGSDRRQRDLEEALKNVDYYQALLDRARAGEAKDAEIAAQQANIARLEAQLRTETLERQGAIASAEAELRQAQRNYERNQILYSEGATSLVDLDQAQEAYETAQANLTQRQAQLDNTLQTLRQQITQEQGNLAQLREVRPVDIRVAQAELERARIAVEQRRADLEDTQVRVPVAGQILRINTRVGEQVNTQEGIVELGRTDAMFAIAEVYETEITRVRIGQSVTLVSEYGGFAGEVRGTVDHIGLQVGARQLSSNSSDPTTDENTRVVEVKIRINPEDNDKVARLTNMQVRVTIQLESEEG